METALSPVLTSLWNEDVTLVVQTMGRASLKILTLVKIPYVEISEGNFVNFVRFTTLNQAPHLSPQAWKSSFLCRSKMYL